MKNLFSSPYLKLLIVISLIVLFLLIVVKNINSPLSRWDEATNALIVLENKDKNLFEPLSLNGEAFLEKPPVWYELTIITTKIFGFNSISLRLVSVLSTIILIGSISFFVYKKFGTNAAVVSASTLIFSPILFFKFENPFSQHTMLTADLDALFILLILTTHFFLYKIQERKIFVLFAGIFAAIAFLTKGPFAFLPFIFFLFTNIYLKKQFSWKRFSLSIFITLAIIMIWNLFMFNSFGQLFINEFYGYHLFGRGITPVEGHVNSPFYFATIILNPTLFATGISSVILTFRNRKSKDSFVSNASLGARIIFIISLLIQTKLSWYILPLYFYISLINSQIIFSEKKLKILLIFQLLCGLIVSVANLLL